MKSTSLLAISLLVLVLMGTPDEVMAKRLLPQFKVSPVSPVQTSSKSKGVRISVKFRSDRQAVIISATNLELAANISYELTYFSRGVSQGAGGSIPTNAETATREVLFGTCSAGVCRYDPQISKARLVVTTTLKNGKKIVKPFRLKV